MYLAQFKPEGVFIECTLYPERSFHMRSVEYAKRWLAVLNGSSENFK